MQQLRSKMAQRLNKKDVQQTRSPRHRRRRWSCRKLTSRKQSLQCMQYFRRPPKATTTRKKKKDAKLIGPLGRKATLALKNSKSSRKVTKGKAKSTALVAHPWLNG